MLKEGQFRIPSGCAVSGMLCREKTNFPSEEHVIFTGNLFETINNLIFDIIYIKIGQDSC